MQNATTILQQLLHLLPETRFESFVGQHKADRYVKTFSCRNQLCTLVYAQATGKDSLRGIETGLRSLDSMWYHLGLTSVARSTIAYANEHRSSGIYESLIDRGYFDLALLKAIVEAEHHFVIRLKKNAQIVRIEEHRTPMGTGVIEDERIAFALPKSQM